MNEENMSIFKLFLASDIGIKRFFKLIDAFGSAKAAIKASKNDLLKIEGIGEKTAKEIENVRVSDKAEKEIALAKKNNINILLFNDPNYPEELNNYPDMPLVLYVKGNILPNDSNSIAIVGARKATNYGKTAAREFAGYFAKKGITVISGLARGIDTEAHLAALDNNGRTIAVLGNGLLVNYPPENRKLQEKIPEHGALISEFPLLMQPDRAAFPRRNRIVAALSKAVLVTEASEKSGAIITATIAAEYGKDVFAVPGSIYSELSKGTNRLIKDGAFPALKPEDIYGPSPLEKDSRTEPEGLEKNEKEVLKLIESCDEGTNFDTIANQLNIDVSNLSTIIFKLEISGLVRAMPGQIYIRVR